MNEYNPCEDGKNPLSQAAKNIKPDFKKSAKKAKNIATLIIVVAFCIATV